MLYAITIEWTQIVFLNSINYLRAISIVLIVAGHCIAITPWHINTLWEKFIVNIVVGGSSFFVFISGFLFFHVYYKKYDYKDFLAKKIKKVLVPYLILSTPPVIYLVFIRGKGPGDFLSCILFYYVAGGAFTEYWYIPFIMLIFFLSPFFIGFIRTSMRAQILGMLITFSIALVAHRPMRDTTVLHSLLNICHSLLYFTPLYLLGIFCAIHQRYIFKNSKGLRYILACTGFLVLLIQANFFEGYGTSHKELFRFAGLDIMLLQKVVLCLFLMVCLHGFEKYDIGILKFLAKVSFPIYFLHPYALYIVSKMGKFFPMKFPLQTNTNLWLLSVMATLGITLIFVLMIKKVLGQRSNIMIGW